MRFSSSKIQSVWNKAKTIRGKEPNLYRKDSCNKIIYRHSYGLTSDMGWEIDHIIPLSKGGSNDLSNLQALHWQGNRQKGTKSRNYC